MFVPIDVCHTPKGTFKFEFSMRAYDNLLEFPEDEVSDKELRPGAVSDLIQLHAK